MNCFTCGSNHMIETTTIYVEKLENGILIVKNVPCKKCSQCGEEFFSMAIMKEIEKAIIKAEIGITPNSDGICIRLPFPPLTEDRRREIAKDVKKLGEDAKVAVRNIRRDMTDGLKKIEKSENLPEDMVKDNQDKIQKLTDKYTANIDSAVSAKEKEVMTV